MTISSTPPFPTFSPSDCFRLPSFSLQVWRWVSRHIRLHSLMDIKGKRLMMSD
ncbi:unnamed protein product [Linum tenue]|uniref:Uncharacterized protein n=1 Tax=Linum tenue TaxID=586396 RepID=A0AAV0MRG7_9ROSI|nr:unnamed protein product [Linum tenue]